ncbi:MAG: gamma carbonic anhydrase family protein [Bradymonadia bacterium]
MSDTAQPHIGPDIELGDVAFIHPTALLYGRVTLADGVSVFPHAVMRAEMHEIKIGARTNIQDFVMVHVGAFTPTVVGEDCSIAHHATLHGCTIGDRVLVGINATIMDGAVIGSNSVVAGHAIVTENAVFPDNSIIAGVPAKQVGERDHSKRNLFNARLYQQMAANYAEGRERLSDEELQTLLMSMTT